MSATVLRGSGVLTIIGVGNPEMGDDGVGIKVAELLDAQVRAGAWAADVEILCADRDPLLAGACLAEGKRVLLVDAVEMGREPGGWRLFSEGDVLPCLEPAGGSTHALSLARVLEIARGLGCAERLRILGIQAGDVRPGRFLSPGVGGSVPDVLSRIREEAEALS